MSSIESLPDPIFILIATIVALIVIAAVVVYGGGQR